MKELQADMWAVDADCRVITTNGFVKQNGKAVMGRGCALEAAQKCHDLPTLLGHAIRHNGNVTTLLCNLNDAALISLPVKHRWWDKADLSLIICSTVQLVKIVDQQKFQQVVLPRPGCGNGKLSWEDVRPSLIALLDDRFTVVDYLV